MQGGGAAQCLRGVHQQAGGYALQPPQNTEGGVQNEEARAPEEGGHEVHAEVYDHDLSRKRQGRVQI